MYGLAADEVARELSHVLSRSIVALLAGVRETKLVSKWERADVTPTHDRQMALKTALHVVRILQPRYAGKSIVTWLCGINPRLENDSPAEILSKMAADYNPDDARRLVRVALAFSTR